MKGIFISYRREDSAGYAGRLYDRLAGYFGADRVFMDVEGIEPGVDFVDAIERAVASCEILIVIIGNEWLAADSAGKRRLDDPKDFVRIETAAALARGIRVVPVLVEDAAMPSAEQLPADLAPLVRRQALELSHKQWEATTGELIRTIEKILNAHKPRSGDAALAAPASERAVQSSGKTGGDSQSGEASMRFDRRYAWIGGALAIVVAAVALVLTQPWNKLGKPALRPGHLVVAPGKVEFPEQSERVAGPPSRITLTNDGETPLRVNAAKVEGAAGDFTLSEDQCSGRTLAPAASCSVGVAFTAQKAGARTASLLFSTSPSNAIVVGLEGRGAAAVVAEAIPPVERPKEPAPPQVVPPQPAQKPPPAQTPQRKPEAPVAQPKRTPTVEAPATRPPAEVATEPEPPARTPSPAPAPVAALPSALPRVGDTWEFRSRSIWKNVAARNYTHQVVAVSEHEVRETMSDAGGADKASDVKSFGPDTRFVERRGNGYYSIEFNPFILALGALSPGTAWKSLAYPAADPFFGNWSTHGRAFDWDSVTVPGGTFKALRVQIDGNRAPTGSVAMRDSEPVRILQVIWYAPDAKRAVKVVRTVYSMSGNRLDEDTYELVRYRLQ